MVFNCPKLKQFIWKPQ